MRRILVNPHRNSTETRRYDQNIESIIPYTIDWSVVATDRSTSVSTAAWTSEGLRDLTIANESLSSDVASADISASWSGRAVLKCVATFADGNTESQYVRINIHDPEYRGFS